MVTVCRYASHSSPTLLRRAHCGPSNHQVPSLPGMPLAFLSLSDVPFSRKPSPTNSGGLPAPRGQEPDPQRCLQSDPTCAHGSAASSCSASVCADPRRPDAAGLAVHGSRSDFGSDSAAFGPCDQRTASGTVCPDPSAGTVAAALTQISRACARDLPRPWRAPICPVHA